MGSHCNSILTPLRGEQLHLSPAPSAPLSEWSISLCSGLSMHGRSVVSGSSQPHGLYSMPGSSVHAILQARIL